MKQDWKDILNQEMQKEYFQKLEKFVDDEYNSKDIYPAKENLYTALDLTGYSETKVLILGQDPYHGPNQAHGLSFSVASQDAKFPPSLRNIFKELEADLGISRTKRDLSDWAEQGVLLLNTVLTVQASKAGSHRGKGWEIFTDSIIKALNDKSDQVVFVLWGGEAKKKIPLITNSQHKIITSAHPSPLSAYNGFFDSKPFSKINKYLEEAGLDTINW